MKSKIFLSVLGMAFAWAGCTVPDMQVSQGMAQDTQAMAVNGRSAFRFSLGREKGFGFGNYQLEDIRRGWTSRYGSEENELLQVSDAYQKYSFGIRDTIRQESMYIQAAARQKEASVELPAAGISLGKQNEFLQVALRSPESGTWTLTLDDPGHYLERLKFVGKLTNGQQEVEVKPIYKWAGKSLTSDVPLGYEFSREGHVLATVQTVNNGKVWLKQTVSPDMQMVLAGTCGALLLYNKLDEN